MLNGFDAKVIPAVTAGAYSAGDVVGGLLTFPVAEKGDGKVVVIEGAIVTLKAAITSTLTLHLFDEAPDTIADNGAYSIGASHIHKLIASITFNAVVDHGTPNSYQTAALSIPVAPVNGNIYGYLVDATGFTPASTSDVQVRLRGRVA